MRCKKTATKGSTRRVSPTLPSSSTATWKKRSNKCATFTPLNPERALATKHLIATNCPGVTSCRIAIDLIQRDTPPNIRWHIQIFSLMDGRFALFEASFGDDFQRQLALEHFDLFLAPASAGLILS